MSKRRAAGVGHHEVLTPTEVARWLRTPKSTLYKLCQDGQIPAKKIGRHWRFDRVILEEWFKTRTLTRTSTS